MLCDHPFWRFSLAVYAEPDVAPECLALQDRLGIDVNVLLFAAWLGSARAIVLVAEDLATIEAAVQPWRDAVVRPLRGVRRDIKAMSGLADDDVAALRKEVAALELRAEQIEQAMLYGITGALGLLTATATADEATRRNIAAVGQSRGAPALSAPRLTEAALKQASSRSVG